MLAFLFAFFYIDADGHGPGGDHSAEAAHHGGAARISLSKEDRNSNYCRIGSVEQRWSNNSKIGCFTRGAPFEALPVSCIIERT
jgi:D-tyrosyl-tRNA(Tyr) deacylase